MGFFEFPASRIQEAGCFSVCKLALIKLCVKTVSFQKFRMISLFNDLAVPHNQNQIGLTDGGEAMCNNKGSSSLHHGVESFLDTDFCTGID